MVKATLNADIHTEKKTTIGWKEREENHQFNKQLLFTVILNLAFLSCAGRAGLSFNYISPERRSPIRKIDRRIPVLDSALLLQPSSGDVPSNPRRHVLAYFDHDEEEEAVDYDHAEENS